MRVKKICNCKYNDFIYCNNKNVKRSLFGIGARLCVFNNTNVNVCEFQEKSIKPKIKPPPQKQK